MNSIFNAQEVWIVSQEDHAGRVRDFEVMDKRPSGEIFEDVPDDIDIRVYVANVNGGDSREITHEIKTEVIRATMYRRPKIDAQQWEFLTVSEHGLYGAHEHSYTSVHYFEDDGVREYLGMIWEQAQISVEAEADTELPGDALQRRTAARVARVLAVIAFGPEFLIR